MCLRAWGTPSPYSRAVVQARRCDPTRVAAREDRRAQQPEEPVRRCAQRALHASRPRRATVRHRFIDRCKLTKLPDSICDLRSLLSLYGRPPIAFGIQSGQARPHCRDVSENALTEIPMCVCKMDSLTSLYSPLQSSRRVWPRRASAGAAGTRSATSCQRCLSSQAARGYFTCAPAALCCRSRAVMERRLCVGSRQARRPQPPQRSARI